MHRSDIRPLLATATLVLAALAAAACGDDDDVAAAPPVASTVAATFASTATPAATPTQGDGGTTEVVAVDYAFQGLPRQIAPGTKLALRNTSATEMHELVAVRLPEGESRSAAELFRLPDEQLQAVLAEMPDLVLAAAPGKAGSVALGNGVLTKPGRYLLFCAIPTGADPVEYARALEAAGDAPPSVTGGPPHFTRGMFGDLSVG